MKTIIFYKIRKYTKGLLTFSLLLILPALSSCNDWFDVTSSNEVREKDHYSNDMGFQQTLIGCYISMAEQNLFGKNLSWYLPDILANETRSYSGVSSGFAPEEYMCQQHSYTNTYTKSLMESIWSNGYSVIANANEALAVIDEKEPKMDPINYHVIKGELLGIRAFMHFQLLRLYGYGSWPSRKAELDAKKTLPYVTTVNKDLTEQATGREYFSMLEKDLTEAVSLLKDYDPVCGTHESSYYDEVNDAGFYNNRNSRLNYYAVKALQSQVYLWEGSFNEALAAAEEVINALRNGASIMFDNENTFILSMMDASTLNNTNWSMASESLFSLAIQDLSLMLNSYINPTYKDADYHAIYLTPQQAIDLYDDSGTATDETSVDIRFTTLLYHNVANPSFEGYVSLKFIQDNLTSYHANKIPVIRLPEVYYIAAESYLNNGNLQRAMDLLNTIREKRGLYSPLSGLSADEINEQIKREYRKEFLGEGEIFYYYKRTGALSIPNFEEMTDVDYVLPFPDLEIQSGRVQ